MRFLLSASMTVTLFVSLAIPARWVWAQSSTPSSGPPHGPITSDRTDLPLAEAGRQMRAVENRMEQKDTSQQTQQLQQQIIGTLAELIQQQQRKCEAGKAQQQTSRQQDSQPESTPGTAASNEPAGDNVGLADAEAGPLEYAQLVRRLNEQAWGNLPPDLREPVLNVERERFLPKYETLIEQYFLRLAEEDEWSP